MKYLITGVSGFVARHFIDYASSADPEASFLGLDLKPPRYRYDHAFSEVKLLDIAALEREVGAFKPDYIVHLASFSSVARSWERPRESFANNTSIFLNLVEAIRDRGLPTRVLSVGSSEEYGVVDPDHLPLREDHRLNPISPYAVARVAQEQLSRIYARSYGLDIVITRSFNHVGVGQEPVFAIPSLVKQFVEWKMPGTLELQVGDTAIVRDFLDVRDVARAYYLLLKEGESGEVYNVCGGAGHSIADVIRMIGGIAGKDYREVVDPTRVRPNDNRAIIGSFDKIKARTAWQPEIGLEESLLAIYRSLEEGAHP
ncbi:MAG: GDP-mannose 4,6-dehydratase [Spirochaetales bacterium]|nr:GDP-mannose 4,6-dehydratase [Spirochaetales bacterium]